MGSRQTKGMRESVQVILVLVVALAAVFAGVTLSAPSETIEAGDRLVVVATTGQVADLARNVGGDLVEVRGLMGPGVDPHLYTPAEGDVLELLAADLILYNGLRLEGQFGEVFEEMADEKTIVAVSRDLPHEMLLVHPQYPDEADPHIWFSPEIWMRATDTVAAAMADADPDNAETYLANAQAYKAKIAATDALARVMLETIPADKRVLVTAHDAFGYFGAHYGFEVVGIQGISTETEAGVSDLQRVADLIATRGIPAIFVESSVSPATIEAVEAAVLDRGGRVTIGGQLYSDALGAEGTPEGTYLGMLEYNVRTITAALGGNPDATPAAATPVG